MPLREELQNRHVRFAGGEGGLWAEPVQPMVGRGGRAVRAASVAVLAQRATRGDYFLTGEEAANRRRDDVKMNQPVTQHGDNHPPSAD